MSIPGKPFVHFADRPVASQAGLPAVVAALLEGASKQLDHPGPLARQVSFLPLLLQVFEMSILASQGYLIGRRHVLT